MSREKKRRKMKKYRKAILRGLRYANISDVGVSTGDPRAYANIMDTEHFARWLAGRIVKWT